LPNEVLRRVVEHRPDQLSFFRMEHCLDLDHTVIRFAPADVAPLLVVLRAMFLVVSLHASVLPGELVELRRRGEPRVLEDQGLVRGGRDAKQRAHLRIGHLTTTERVGDRRELDDLACHADPFSRGDQIPADAPCEPVCT
jgi:hypothetical protein